MNTPNVTTVNIVFQCFSIVASPFIKGTVYIAFSRHNAEDISIDDENKTALKRKLEPRFFGVFGKN